MRPSIGQLLIEQIIVHKVPKRRVADSDTDLRVTDVESQLDDELKAFFENRIKDSLVGLAYEVALDEGSPSPAPKLIFDHLAQQGPSFVEMSQGLARHLYASQTGVNPAGVLAVIQAAIADAPCLVVLKLEWDSGVRIQEVERDGQITFDLLTVKDLILNERTRVYKAAAFHMDGEGFEGVSGIVADLQRIRYQKRDIAEFFLGTFLGCRHRTAPDVMTKTFFFTAQEYFENEVSEPTLKAQYHLGLVAMMNNNETDVRPFHFADQTLLGEHRQGLLTYLRNNDAPADPFPKNTSLIDAKLRRTLLDFDSGLVLSGKPEAFAAHVVISESVDGTQVTEVRDRVKRVHA